MDDKDIIIINSDALVQPATEGDMWQRRLNAYAIYDAPGVPTCSVVVQGYNRLHKTKYAVECVLKYTQDVNYELILVDNGSEDGTFEFFKSVEHANKKIIRVTKNIGLAFPGPYIRKIYTGKYLVVVNNDIYVTQNWLSNLIKCYESDHRIGFVTPVSSNVSNGQEVDLNYTNFEDMQKKAANFNKSDPKKWEERMRILPVIGFFSRHVIDIVGIYDPAYIHDFTEDDYCARLRHSGYKMMLCQDTWVCHDHDFKNSEDKDRNAFLQAIDEGRATFKQKFRGIDAWDDFNTFEPLLLLPIEKMAMKKIAALVIDPNCGSPVLHLRHILKQRNIVEIECSAFTTHAKYYNELTTVAEYVQCDRIDFIQSHYTNDMFTVIALCKPINTYPEPIKLLQSLCMFLKSGGMLVFKIYNTINVLHLLRIAGVDAPVDDDLPSALPISDTLACLDWFGMHASINNQHEYHPLSKAEQRQCMKILMSINPNASEDDLFKALTKNYIISAVKG